MSSEEFLSCGSNVGAVRVAQSKIIDWAALSSGYPSNALTEASSGGQVEIRMFPADAADEGIHVHTLWTSMSERARYVYFRSNEATTPPSHAYFKAAPTVPVANQNGYDPIRPITPDDALAVLDRQARTRLEMTGSEFLVRLKSGEFRDEADPEKRSNVAFLRMLASAIGR